MKRRRNEKSDETKRQALKMYLEGMGFRGVGRALGISYGAVYKWVRKSAQELELPKSDQKIKAVELDELYTYVGSKKTTDESGLLRIDWQNSSSLLSVETGPLKQG